MTLWERRRGGWLAGLCPCRMYHAVTLAGSLVSARRCLGEPSGPCMVLMLRLPVPDGEGPRWRVGLQELAIYVLGDQGEGPAGRAPQASGGQYGDLAIGVV